LGSGDSYSPLPPLDQSAFQSTRPVRGAITPIPRSPHPQCLYTLSILKGVAFEWDARKNAVNRLKHGIDFVDAVRIFDGPIVEGPDEREDQEVRLIAFGALGLRVIAVVYTWRGETCRIISARRATNNERKAYYQALHGQAEV
jgi:uncharacterized DUF497 family protein